MHAFQVFDAQQREVSVATGLCASLSFAIPNPVELSPGQSLVITDAWQPGTSTLDGRPLVPGNYRLRGRVAGDNRPIHSRLEAVTLVP